MSAFRDYKDVYWDEYGPYRVNAFSSCLRWDPIDGRWFKEPTDMFAPAYYEFHIVDIRAPAMVPQVWVEVTFTV